jgi:hypothetical protein
VRVTNNIVNTLVAEHHMCLDCATSAAVAFVWAASGKPARCHFCSKTCGAALLEFLAGDGFERSGIVSPDQLPSRIN